MASFFKRRNDEKGAESPPIQQMEAAEYSNEEGEVNEEQDDLHRGMKPRQLSACSCLDWAAD